MPQGRGPAEDNLQRVWRYYDRTESRIGYGLLLGGTKHFGWYLPGEPGYRFKPAMARMENELAARLNLASGARVLDAGSGMGEVARSLAARHGLVVEGIDILDFNLEEATQRSQRAGLSDRTHFRWADYHHLPFDDESFDGAYTMETLVHAADYRAVLEEFFRVLKPGGRLVLVEYARSRSGLTDAEATKAFEAVCEIAAMPAWLELFDGVMETSLSDVGFTDVSREEVTDQILPMLKVFSALGRFPYWVGRRIGKVEKTVNAMSGVEMYAHQNTWSYNIYTAQKPLDT